MSATQKQILDSIMESVDKHIFEGVNSNDVETLRFTIQQRIQKTMFG